MCYYDDCSIELQNRLNRDPDLSRISILGVNPCTMLTHITILAWKNPNGLMRTPQKSASDVLAAASFRLHPGTPKSMYINGSQSKPVRVEVQDSEKRPAVEHARIKFANLKDGGTVLADWA